MKCSLRNIYQKAPLKSSFEAYRLYIEQRITLDDFHYILSYLNCWIIEKDDMYLEKLDLFFLEKGLAVPESLRLKCVDIRRKRFSGELNSNDKKFNTKLDISFALNLACYFVASGFQLSKSCFYASYIVYCNRAKIIKASTIEKKFSEKYGVERKSIYSMETFFDNYLEMLKGNEVNLSPKNRKEGFFHIHKILDIVHTTPETKEEYIQVASIIDSKCSDELREKLTGERR